MRLLIFLLALSSAFFVSKSQAFELDMDDLISQIYKKMPATCLGPYGSSSNTLAECESMFESAVQSKKSNDRYMGGSSSGYEKTETIYRVKFSFNECNSYMSPETGCTGLPISKSIYNDYGSTEVGTCTEHELHIHDVPDPSDPSNTLCAKEKNTDNCPTPTDNDPFVFGTGGQTEKCFKNPDGTQCKIQTDEQGGYNIPVSYGAAEPVQCTRAPDKEVDKTSPPEEKPAPEDTDDGAEMNELDALNKINDNLDAMNENQVAASDSNDERLDRVSEEIQIGNEILGEIRYNTDLIESNTDDTNDLLGETNGLLADILDKTGGPPDGDGGEPCTGDDCEEPDTFTITAGRKNAEKGLNSIFTDDQRQVITDEIDEKKQEIEDYFEQIESESSSLFDINPSLGGGYEERIEVIKGVEVDMGLGRLASFFQLIAAAVMLCSTLTALYILLGP